MKNKIDTQELVEKDIISKETAQKIEFYYQKSRTRNINFFFGLMGFSLLGAGFLSIAAYNWDNFPNLVKTLLPFSLLAVSQGVCIYVLLRKRNEILWKEGSALLIFAVLATSMTLLSHIYPVAHETHQFFLTWLAISIPFIYIMGSSILSLLCLLIISVICIGYPFADRMSCWMLLLLLLPYYYYLCIKREKDYLTVAHHWILPMTIASVLLIVVEEFSTKYYFLSLSFFGCIYWIGRQHFFEKLTSAYKVLGSASILLFMLLMSYTQSWEELNHNVNTGTFFSVQFFFILCFSLLTFVLIGLHYKRVHTFRVEQLEGFAFALLWIAYALRTLPIYVVIGINGLIFFIGLAKLVVGVRTNRMGLLNYGLAIIIILFVFRLIDLDITFLIKGICFICLGTVFFIVNYWIAKQNS